MMDEKAQESPIIVNRCKSVEENMKYDYGPISCPKYEAHLNRCNKGKILRRKIPNQNIVARLIRRETLFVKPNVDSNYAVRLFHQNVVPNFTVVDIEKPPCFLRKFTPDGQHFIAFSSDQTSIEIYVYKGASAAEKLLSNFSGDETNLINPCYRTVRTKIFEQFFKLKHTVNVAINDEQLNRECSLFTDDSNYIIIGSAAYISEDTTPPFFEIYQNNESVTPNPRNYLENYTIHLVDIKNGILRDRRSFKSDKIVLSHNQGVYLYQDFLCVLSVQHQTIHVFQVTTEGSFVNVRCIGRFCHDDDSLHISAVIYDEMLQRNVSHNQSAVRYDEMSHRNVSHSLAALRYDEMLQRNVHRPYREITINALKHRILVFLYKRAVYISSETKTYKPILEFYQCFQHFLMMRMWKMQLLDKSHILIKYASEEVITLRIHDPVIQPSFFVVYNMITTEVLAVYENTSEELLSIFENFCDYFRNAALHAPTLLSCSPSNTIYARTLQHRFLQTIINARFGGQTEAVKRLLSQLPISSQSYSVSPYLDLSLFSYDDKWVSVMERPKASADLPIRFYARDSGLLRYKIYPGLYGKNHALSARRLVAFTFHPCDPFAISVQRTNADYIVNFHIRHFIPD